MSPKQKENKYICERKANGDWRPTTSTLSLTIIIRNGACRKIHSQVNCPDLVTPLSFGASIWVDSRKRPRIVIRAPYLTIVIYSDSCRTLTHVYVTHLRAIIFEVSDCRAWYNLRVCHPNIVISIHHTSLGIFISMCVLSNEQSIWAEFPDCVSF